MKRFWALLLIVAFAQPIARPSFSQEVSDFEPMSVSCETESGLVVGFLVSEAWFGSYLEMSIEFDRLNMMESSWKIRYEAQERYYLEKVGRLEEAERTALKAALPTWWHRNGPFVTFVGGVLTAAGVFIGVSQASK